MTIKEALWSASAWWTLWRYHSRLGWRDAPRYTRYWHHCQDAYRAWRELHEHHSPYTRAQAEEFHRRGVTTIWHPRQHELALAVRERVEQDGRWTEAGVFTGPLYGPEIARLFQGVLGDWLRTVYGCHFKIYYGICFRSWHQSPGPTGSQLWHADGGPGTCINVLWYLSEATVQNGALACLPWPHSRRVYGRELAHTASLRRQQAAMPDREGKRAIKCEFYRQQIERDFTYQVVQPTGSPGLIVAFSNNLLHKGGYPEPGQTRLACVFHCYPSDRPTAWDRYEREGIQKRGPYPLDPVEVF